MSIKPLNRKGISRFRMELSAFSTTVMYQKLKEVYPIISMVWEDYTLSMYMSGGVYRDVTCGISATTIEIYKGERGSAAESIYHWADNALLEFNGERFTENHREYDLLEQTGDWFRDLLTNLAEGAVLFQYLTEPEFAHRTLIKQQDYISFQQKLLFFKEDLHQICGFEVQVALEEYFSYHYWYTGISARLHLTDGATQFELAFILGQNRAQVTTEEQNIQARYPQVFRVVKMLLKERTYGQVAKALLRMGVE